MIEGEDPSASTAAETSRLYTIATEQRIQEVMIKVKTAYAKVQEQIHVPVQVLSHEICEKIATSREYIRFAVY